MNFFGSIPLTCTLLSHVISHGNVSLWNVIKGRLVGLVGLMGLLQEIATKNVNILHSNAINMTDLSLCFEVHQPLRLNKNFFWGRSLHKEVVPNLSDFTSTMLRTEGSSNAYPINATCRPTK